MDSKASSLRANLMSGPAVRVISAIDGKSRAAVSYLVVEERKTEVQQDLVDRLVRALDDKARKGLTAYALMLLRRLDLTGSGEGDLVKLAEDITSDAICKTLTGVRQWDPEKTPCPIDHLCSTVKSLVSAAAKKACRSPRVDSLESLLRDEISDFRQSPHTIAEGEEFFYGLLEEVGDDEVCARMLDLFEKGYKPGEVAEELNLTSQEVQAAQKRLRRMTKAYLQKTQGGN